MAKNKKKECFINVDETFLLLYARHEHCLTGGSPE